MAEGVRFQIVGERFAVVKLPAGAPIPAAPAAAEIWSATITPTEVSLICGEEHVPNCEPISVERTWRCIMVAGPMEFELKGILASLLVPLAEAKISVLAMSTYNTDYIFVKERHLDNAIAVLVTAGHRWG